MNKMHVSLVQWGLENESIELFFEKFTCDGLAQLALGVLDNILHVDLRRNKRANIWSKLLGRAVARCSTEQQVSWHWLVFERCKKIERKADKKLEMPKMVIPSDDYLDAMYLLHYQSLKATCS